MIFGQSKQPGSLDFSIIRSHLASIPIGNEHVVREEREGGRVLLIRVTLVYRGFQRIFAKILRLKTEKCYQLDGVGLALYRRIDGRTSIEALVDSLAEEHRLSFFESRGLVLQYIHSMTQRGLLVVGNKEASPE